MKKRLFLKFTAAYAILALLMFLVTTTLGRQLFYDRLVSDCAEKLYAEASVIAGSRASRYFQRTTTIEDLYENMLTIAASNSAVIRVIDTCTRSPPICGQGAMSRSAYLWTRWMREAGR